MYSLTYVSSATASMTRDQLQSLLDVSMVNNRRDGVTGMLLHKNGNFMQVMEGSEDVLRRTLARVRDDARHDGIIMLRQGPLSERHFPDWSMGYCDLRGDSVTPPGYREFIDTPLTGDEFADDPNRAQKLLSAFRRPMREQSHRFANQAGAALKGDSNPLATVACLQDLIEREKAALAREIHDDLGGYLIAAAMDVTNLRHRFAGNDEDAGRKFDRLAKVLNGAVDMMRRVTEELHPTLLDNVGLFGALKWEIKHLSRRTGLIVNDDFPVGELSLNKTASIALFRAGQEALMAAEHRRGVEALEFTMKTEKDSLDLTVVADGDSGPAAPDSRGAIALGFLAHRVEALGGSLTLFHPDSGGMVLRMRFALADLRRAQ